VIARLEGRLVEKSADGLVVDVAGVGYAVHVSLQTLASLPAVGAVVTLLVHTEVREDAIDLFGFEQARERTVFHLLRKVKGLGPRISLAVLSGMAVNDLCHAIAAGDVARLQTIPGVGRRLAERIVVECREPMTELELLAGPPSASARAGTLGGAQGEAVSALVNLGYKRNEAEDAVRKHSKTGASLEEVIRAALQGLSA
jgi:Holliday junction DNA helicase RuvA